MNEIEFSDWEKLDFRIGEVKNVEDHPKADKLYILKVDLGDKEITLVAGIKQYYKREEVLGKKVVVFTNLKPAVLRGIKSEGMLLAAEKDGKVTLITADKNLGNGAKVR